MVNLLKNEKGLEKAKAKPRPAAKKSQEAEPGIDEVDPALANPEKYKDPEGITISKLRFGYWLVKNRRNFINIGLGILALIGLVTWSRFIFYFGEYVLWGMRQDKQMLEEMAANNSLIREYVLSSAAEDIIIKEVKAVNAGSGKYDFAAYITNPNDRHAGYFDYSFSAGDNATPQQSGFILPGESKYIMALAAEFSVPAASAKLNISDASWLRIDPHKYPDWQSFRDDRLRIEVSEQKFTPARSSSLSEKLNLNNLYFKVFNNTAFNYYEAGFNVVLFNGSQIAGVNSFKLDRFAAGETRTIDFSWPGSLGRVSDMTVVPDIDIIDEKSYFSFEGEGDNFNRD